jgi:hypothetical protein
MKKKAEELAKEMAKKRSGVAPADLIAKVIPLLLAIPIGRFFVISRWDKKGPGDT